MSKRPEDMTVAELKDELRGLDEKVSGKKSELISRLKAAKKQKSPKSSRKSPARTPEERAADLPIGEERTGRDGIQYEVTDTKAGKRWRKCSASTATCSPVATSVSIDTELRKMTIPQLKARMTQEELKQLRSDVRKARKSSPKKDDYINFLLVKESESRPSPSRKTSKRPTSSRRLTRKEKGKEKVSPVPSRRKKTPTGRKTATPSETIDLDGWTVVGELEPAFNFMKIYNEERLRAQIAEKDPQTKKKYKGFLRLEADKDCKTNCGAQILGVNMMKGEYPLSVDFERNYIVGLDIGEAKPSGPERGDFSFVQHLVIADVSAMYNFIRDVDTFDQLLSKTPRPGNIKVISNPPRKTPYLMACKAQGENGIWRALHIKRSS